jgi:nucleotide-binding universal stress UspA family protein
VLPIEVAPTSTPIEDSPRGRRLEEEIERHLGSACTQLRAAGISCRPITLFGDPAKEIITFAEEGHYDLIVMGRRGRGAVGKVLLGSVSDRVVKAASCPVTVVS